MNGFFILPLYPNCLRHIPKKNIKSPKNVFLNPFFGQTKTIFWTSKRLFLYFFSLQSNTFVAIQLCIFNHKPNFP